MSSNESYFKTGIAVPTDENGHTDGMGILTHTVLEDIFYNIIHGIVLKTHREEKIARANSAAIIVSQKAESEESISNFKANKPIKVLTESAIYEDSTITISGNPLEKLPASEIRCPKCGLPRLLHPISGNKSQPPDPEIEYCTRHPFIDKAGHDIYGQSFPIDATGPGKGKKKSQANKVGELADNTDTSKVLSAAPSPPPSSQPTPTNTFPLVKCRCGRQVFIKRFAAHLGKCIGGRPSGRAAQLKINGIKSNTSSNSTPSSNTPPSSRKGTPVPAPSKKVSSSQKRELPEEFDENEDSEDSPKKKKRKLPTAIKKKDVNASFGKGAGNGVTKKWKSGRQTGADGKIKLTLNNSSQLKSPSMPTSDAEGEAEQTEKPIRPNGTKAESVSSQTLSSP